MAVVDAVGIELWRGFSFGRFVDAMWDEGTRESKSGGWVQEGW